MANHRYWRVRASATYSSGFMGCASLQLRGVAAGPDLTVVGQTSGGSATLGGAYAYTSAFDRNAATFWTTGGTAPPAGGHYIYADFGVGTPVSLLEFTYQVRPDAFREDPQDVHLEFSDDLVTWTELFAQTGLAAWTAGEIRTFTYTAPPPPGTRARQLFVTSIAADVIGNAVARQLFLTQIVADSRLLVNMGPVIRLPCWQPCTAYGTRALVVDLTQIRKGS